MSAGNLKSNLPKALAEVKSDLGRSLPKVEQRLGRFEKSFEQEFPLGVGGRRGGEERGMAEALTWALLGIPLSLYAMKLNGAAIVDLHGILERFATRDTARFLGSTKKKKQVLTLLFERQSLSSLAPILVELGIWDKADAKFVTHLTALRNGTAHKNPRIISRELLGGAKISFLDIDATLSKIDVVPLLVKSIRLLNKLVRGGRRGPLK